MRAMALGVAALAVATLTACGGATVDSADVTASQSSESSGATGASTSESSSRTTATVTVTSTRSGAAGSTAPVAQDQPASAVDSIPRQTSRYSAGEQAFLDHLRDGLNIDGVEDQLTATGASVCANDTITRDAVAGQLVEQRRTDMNPEAVGQLLTDTARANLC